MPKRFGRQSQMAPVTANRALPSTLNCLAGFGAVHRTSISWDLSLRLTRIAS
jgi:hypothetical protein